MPGNLNPPVPVDVFPAGPMASLNEELRIEAFVNAYPDGASDRAALSLNPRHFFHLTRLVTAQQYQNLWDFLQDHLIEPFYFYNPRETVPPFSFDPTGQAFSGRYVVVFDGGWSDQLVLGRSAVSLNLREVG